MKPTPITRKEMYLYALGAIQTLEPVTREEMYLANLCGQNNALPLPCTRYEQYLYKMNGGNIDVPDPVTRLEMFLYRACGYEDKGTPTAVTREEMYWAEYISQYVDWKTITDTLPIEFTSKGGLIHWTVFGKAPTTDTETGVLPLTFTAKAGNAVDWTIYGNDDNGTENFFGDYETFPSTHIANVNTWTSYDGGGICQRVKCEGNTEYTLSFANTSSLFRISASSTNDVPTANNPVIVQRLVNTTKSNSETFTTPNNAKFIIVQISYDEQELLNSAMLVKGPSAPDHYIPYQVGVGEQRVDGYYVPLTISQIGQADKNYDIYIGTAPLTEGETVSKASTGIDIELFEGENTVSTTLYNKPETSITYTDYLGVGEYVNGQWQIPLTVSDGTNTTTVNIPIDAPLTEGQSVSDTVEITAYEGTNTLDTTLTVKPDATITYK